MPSYARKHQLEGALIYHVYNRSHGKVFIFKDQEDFEHFGDLLKIYKEEFRAKIYHWVIMSNHYHLLLELETPERISKMMAGLARAYTHYHHRKYKTSGYLWQGRFKMQAVEKNSYLLACGRYIERNPVRAGLVSLAWDYAYSSCSFYCEGKQDGLTEESLSFGEFGDNQEQRQKAYKEFLKNFDQEEETHFQQFEHPVGNQMFVDRLFKEGFRLRPRHRGRPRGKNLFVNVTVFFLTVLAAKLKVYELGPSKRRFPR